LQRILDSLGLELEIQTYNIDMILKSIGPDIRDQEYQDAYDEIKFLFAQLDRTENPMNHEVIINYALAKVRNICNIFE
jgi:hypothetical protein